MTTKEVADRLVSLCREGKNFDAIDELYADDIVSVEPEGTPQAGATNGKAAVRAKEEGFFNAVEEVHDSWLSDPLVADAYFSVASTMDLTMQGMRMNWEEVSLYEVRDGKIVREEFFYTPPSQ